MSAHNGTAPSQARAEQAAARMKKWAQLYQRHPGIKMTCRQHDGRWTWDVTRPGQAPETYPDADAMMAALLPDEPAP
jgi:hypothetical protein